MKYCQCQFDADESVQMVRKNGYEVMLLINICIVLNQEFWNLHNKRVRTRKFLNCLEISSNFRAKLNRYFYSLNKEKLASVSA